MAEVINPATIHRLVTVARRERFW